MIVDRASVEEVADVSVSAVAPPAPEAPHATTTNVMAVIVALTACLTIPLWSYGSHHRSRSWSPHGLRGRPEALLACVLYGRELGLGPMEALTSIDVIDGRPSPSAELLNRLIREAGPHDRSHRIERQDLHLERDPQGRGESQELSFSIEEAMRARLTSRPAWKAYPADMLWTRALTRLHRRLFPDVGTRSSRSGECDLGSNPRHPGQALRAFET